MIDGNHDREFPEDELDHWVLDQKPPEPSLAFLDRCLATIPRPGPEKVRATRRTTLRHRVRLLAPLLSTAAAVVVAYLILQPQFGESDVLAQVNGAWSVAPAYHLRQTSLSPEGKPLDTRDIWALRGSGRHEEVWQKDVLTAVIVDNLRWRFQYDVLGGLVAAWPSQFADPKHPCDDSYLANVNDREWIAWQKKTKAEVVTVKEHLGSREVLKTTATWPGSQHHGTAVIWFDPATHRPLKTHFHGPDREWETIIEYIAPADVPAEKFRFQVPRNATLEVNDLQFGRQVYSEGHAERELPQ